LLQDLRHTSTSNADNVADARSGSCFQIPFAACEVDLRVRKQEAECDGVAPARKDGSCCRNRFRWEFAASSATQRKFNVNILIVLTTHDELGTSGKKTGFWLEELAAPYYAFKDAGADVTLASPLGGQPPIDPRSDTAAFQTDDTRRFRRDPAAEASLASTVKLSDISPEDYDAVFYCGGHGAMYDVAEDLLSIALLENMFAANKPVSAVCHGSAVFRHTKGPDGAPLVHGKKVAGFTNTEEAAVGLTDVVPYLVEDMLKQNGGIYSKVDNFQAHMVADGNLVTGQNPASSKKVAAEVVRLLLRSSR
jgi:putative intracellular protease/amidase